MRLLPARLLLASPRSPGSRPRAAFTLVETALALGIVAFALIPLLGLLPIGLQMSHNASDLTLSAQIAQRLAGIIQQAGYSSFQGTDPAVNAGPGDVNYYFDVEGQPLKSTGGGVPAGAIYTANILLPSATDPNAGNTSQTNSLVDKANVTTLRVRIVNDPTGRIIGTPSGAIPVDLKARAVTIPVYLANNGG